jgi:hypothetical protein
MEKVEAKTKCLQTTKHQMLYIVCQQVVVSIS